VLLVLTSDRGLCGPYNSAVLKVAQDRLNQVLRAGYDVKLRLVGRRGVQQLRHRGVAIDTEYRPFEGVPEYEPVAALADSLMKEFLAAKISGLEVAYTQFISSGRRRPVIAQILPLSGLPKPQRLPTLGQGASYEVVPPEAGILDPLLPMVVRMRLWQCFLDAAVSEQFERIAAMRAATDNADKMIHSLTVRYNRMRQAQITTELAEIVGGRAGLE
jgi:F-type H+-transporting ATPase subunit gamma